MTKKETQKDGVGSEKEDYSFVGREFFVV